MLELSRPWSFECHVRQQIDIQKESSTGPPAELQELDIFVRSPPIKDPDAADPAAVLPSEAAGHAGAGGGLEVAAG